MSITATTTPGKTLLSPTDHALVLIDFQSQMAFATKSIAPELLRNNAPSFPARQPASRCPPSSRPSPKRASRARCLRKSRTPFPASGFLTVPR